MLVFVGKNHDPTTGPTCFSCTTCLDIHLHHRIIEQWVELFGLEGTLTGATLSAMSRDIFNKIRLLRGLSGFISRVSRKRISTIFWGNLWHCFITLNLKNFTFISRLNHAFFRTVFSFQVLTKYYLLQSSAFLNTWEKTVLPNYKIKQVIFENTWLENIVLYEMDIYFICIGVGYFC